MSGQRWEPSTSGAPGGFEPGIAVDPMRLRRRVARACRILSVAGVLDGILGHVSARFDEHRMMVRCRGPRERGLRFTTLADVHAVDIAGGHPNEEGYAAPNELPIHARVLAAREDVHAVVHAHPPASLLAGLAEVALPPMFGAFNIPAARLAEPGVPVFPRAALINGDALADDLVATMGNARVCLLRGHGIVTVGSSVEEAVVAAVNLEALARVAVGLAQLGVEPRPISSEDLGQLPDLGGGFNDGHSYRHLIAQAAADDVRLGLTDGLLEDPDDE